MLPLAAPPSPPPIVRSFIAFPKKRVDETRAYARRHYGLNTALLKQPHVIVEHYTAIDSYSATYNTFAADVPDPELHELPGTCAHYIIDRDGTIHQLVRLRYICRHTVGLNYTAIGIEHVATSDGGVMGDRRMLRASLRLTRYLMGRFHITVANVIGHNESLSSPYHHERIARLRHQTHGDMRHSTMTRYRRMLRSG
jgi:beta-N-acetylhexosaminidase